MPRFSPALVDLLMEEFSKASFSLCPAQPPLTFSRGRASLTTFCGAIFSLSTVAQLPPPPLLGQTELDADAERGTREQMLGCAALGCACMTVMAIWA